MNNIILLLIFPLIVIGQQNGNRQYPIAYNLFSHAAPTDINSLGNNMNINRAMTDVAQTIAQVQRVLQSDPTLPKLTRGEIHELFENVTREEYERSLMIGDRDRAQHMKALMLVLPYHTSNHSTDNLQEIYNRPPMTRLVENSFKIPPKPKQQSTIEKQQTTGRIKIVSAEIKEPKPTTYRPSIQTKQTVKPEIVTTWSPPKKVTKIVKPEKFSSHYSADSAPFITAMPIRHNVKGMLESIGLFEDKETTTTMRSIKTSAPKVVVPELTPELKELLRSFGLLENESLEKKYKVDDLDQFRPEPFSKSEVALDEFKPLPESLKPEDFTISSSPNIMPNDFLAFKRLPSEKPKVEDSEIEDLLKSYGLIDGKIRSKKSMDKELADKTLTPTKEEDEKVKEIEIKPEIYVDMLSPQFANILDNMGMAKKSSNHQYESSNIKLNKARKIEGNYGGFFQPVTKTNENPKVDDYDKLNQLLETIKQLDNLNANLTQAELEQLNLENFNFSESLLIHGPDPLKNAELDMSKNEVKRQETHENPTRISLQLTETEKDDIIDDKDLILASSVPKTTEELTTEEPKATEEPTTTTEKSTLITEQSRSSILEDSFGTNGADPVTEEPLPPPRRNGFYFLQDINSFLEVGEDPDKVEVRYERNYGDPSRFIPITVP